MLFCSLKPCLKGAVVAAQPELKEHVVALRQLISAPPDIYAELYLTTLYAFAELCQTMPYDQEAPKAYGFLEQQLRTIIVALKLRRGKMLPLHADSETIAEQEPVWTYALFTAGLLWRLSSIQNYYSVDLYKRIGERLGAWHPLAGSLGEPDTYYQILPNPPAFVLESAQFQTLMVGKIVPTVGLRWLAEHKAVFQTWWEVILNQPQPENVLVALLNTAMQREGTVQSVQADHPKSDPIVANDEKEAVLAETPPPHSDALEKITTWLFHKITTQTAYPERGLPLFFKLPQGFFISTSILQEFVAQQSIFKSVDSLLKTLDEAIEKQSLKGSVEDSEKTVFFRYRSTRFEDRTVLEGIILSEQSLSDALKAISPHKEVMPELK